MSAIGAVAARHGLGVVEDAAQAVAPTLAVAISAASVFSGASVFIPARTSVPPEKLVS